MPDESKMKIELYKNHEFIRLFRTGRNSYNVYIAD